MRNVLLTCGGHWVGLALQLKAAMGQVPALRDGRLLVADRARIVPAGCYADRAVQVPDISDPSYVDRLLEICTAERIGVIVPHVDVDLRGLAPHLKRFEQIGTSVVCPPHELVDLCGDKLRFEAFARSEGLPCPRSFPAISLRAEDLPLFAKRRSGSASVGARLCRSLDEARAACDQDADLIFQEVLTGDEVSVDAFISVSGRCTVQVPRIRDKVIGGEATQSHTVRVPALIAIVDRTIAALANRGLRGPLNAQYFLGDTITLIEVNPRLGSASVLANMATRGRFFASILREACGEMTTGDPGDYQDGLHLYRYWGEVYHDGAAATEFVPPRMSASLAAAYQEIHPCPSASR
jgi:carbamoyl-phosphate synthase large subunit